MAGVFSGHLVSSYEKSMQRPTSVFGQPQSSIVTSGAMAFDASMHGGFRQNISISDHLFSAYPSEDTAIKIATLQAKLNKKLGPEYISQRPGPGGGPKLTYAEGWKIINLANEVFGFNGWSSSIINMTTDYMDCNEEAKRYNVGVSCIVRVTLRCGTYHEDIGYGAAENVKSKAQAIDKSKKEAVTDAVKRALRNFGSLLGNCLYDKSYTQEITKIKVPPVKFDDSQLHRRPEFDDTKPKLTSTSKAAPTAAQTTARAPTSASHTKTPSVPIKSEAVQETDVLMTYIPRHLRQEMAAGATTTTPIRKEQVPRNPHGTTHGLNTPVQTPVQQAMNPNRGQYRETESLPLPQPVPFTEQITTAVDGVEIPDADEISYSLDSDDDAFYANVDLGDGDLGRPINFEEGSGGVDVSYISSEDTDTSRTLRDSSDTLQGTAVSGHSSSSSGRGGATAPGSSRFSTNVSLPRVQAGPSNTSRALGGVDNTAGAPVAPPLKSASGLKASAPVSSSSEAKRVVPTSGRSHFPPDMNPAARPKPSESVPAQPQKMSTGTSNASNNSTLKRKADALQASSSSSRQTFQRPGLAQQQSGSENSNRAPLANLDIGTGGDIKRARR